MITVDTRGLNPAFLDQVSRKLKRDLKNKAAILQADAKSFAPVRTGTLRDSIAVREITDGFWVGTDLPYAGYTEFGTRWISPRAWMRRAIARLLLRR